MARAGALLFVATLAQAGVLGTPSLSPLSIEATVASAVTVSISITDPNYILGSANVQRLRADGSALAVVATLRDDGLGGDAVAGDRIYSARFNVLEAAAGSVAFRVSAGFKGELRRTLSAPMSLTVNPAGPLPVIAGASVAPASTATGVALLATFNARIDDIRLVAGSAVLQKIDAAGNVLATLGSLHDDGLDGDAIADDKNYSLRSTVLENNPGNNNYRIAANFNGYPQIVSAPLSVAITGTATGVNIAAPAGGAYLNTPVLTVSGSVGDPAAQVSINGIATPVTNNSYNASVPLNEGPNTLTAVATNSNGTTSTHSILVTLDTTAPRVQIYTPAAAGSTSAASVSVSGLINDIVVGTVNPEQASVSVNGIPARVVNRSFQADNIPLSLGSNTVQAVATDRAGNRATASISILRVPAIGQANLSVVSGNNQSAPVGANLASPLVVRLVDGQGQPQINKPVVYRIISQDGSVSADGSPGSGLSAVAINTDAQGQARAFLKLGSRAGAGNNIVEASAAGIATTADFSASASPGAPNLMVVDSGNNQTGVVGQSLPLPFIAIVTDANNNRLAGVPVSFQVKEGSGSLGGATSLQTTSDSDGRVAASLSLGPEQGVNNNLVEVNFAGGGGFPAAFTATGLVPGPAEQTRISGVVLDNSNNPIPGVTMRLLNIHQGNLSNIPQQMAPPVQTDAQGQFVMTQVPVGVFKLMADGGTATRTGSWPTLDFDMITVSGQNNTLGMPVYLPELNPNNRVCVNDSTGGRLTIAEAPGFVLDIAPGAATFPGGSKTGCVSVTPVNMDKVPMSPGFGQQPRFIVTIQPVGTHFNPPARMTIPNVDGLAPRAVTEMYSYDHDLASFVAIGSATVSEDGSSITSDLGAGVIKAGWHCGGNP
ncbi:choice-of-anchor X domain-containing protein, partial [Rubrivivax sp. A210]|uniref:choice-of-anchor X domain-containing protein n=1 Tax=Rubrivivax sp. A210 TaxID=2772301 RepID=UPI00191809B1